MIQFRTAAHSIKLGQPIGEILLEGNVVAAIFRDGEKGIKIVSAHMEKVETDDGKTSRPPIPAVNISFDPQPYEIDWVANQIVWHPKRETK